jgi:hypothetical protein
MRQRAEPTTKQNQITRTKSLDMKLHRHIKTALLALVGLALANAPGMAQQTNVFIEPTGTDTGTPASAQGNQISVTFGGGVWQNWFVNDAGGAGNGITNYTIAFDTNNPPPSSPTGDLLGSVSQEQGWDGTNGGTLSTFACVDNNFWGGNTVDITKFKSVDFDFKYQTNSGITPTNAAQFNVMVDNGRVSSTGVALTNIANTGSTHALFDGNWHHISAAIPETIAGVTASKGPGFELFNPAGTSNEFTYNVANLELVALTNLPPPPTLGTTPIIQGLWQFADVQPSYDRQDIETTNSNSAFNVDWVGRSKPVTYTWTIGSFPGASAGGFDADVTFTPDPAANINYADPDWSATNAIWLNIQANSDGTVTAGIAWKTNEPAGNSQYFSATNGQLIAGNVETNGLTAPTAVGTWSLTFTSDSNLTITAPNGASKSAVLPPNIAAMYQNVSFFVNSTPNNNANIGQYCVYTGLTATGVQTPINEHFNGGLNTPFLRLESQGYFSLTNFSPPNQIFVTTNDAFWVHWTLPDPGFSLVSEASVKGPFTNFPASPLLNGGERWVLVPNAEKPSANEGFFAVVQYTFSQLIVLLPGESLAPGTATGKSGTPTPQDINLPTTLTVEAVDKNFNPVTGVGDAIQITSDTDAAAFLPLNQNLTNGITVFSGTFEFQTPGTNTVTATDVTTNAIPPAVSSPVVVGD